MLEETIIGHLVVIIGLIVYFNNKDEKNNEEDFYIKSIKETQEIKDKITERDALDLKSIEKAKESSEAEATILREELKELKKLIEKEREQRGTAYGSITQNVNDLKEQYKGLESTANKLSSALKDSSI